MTTIAYDGKGVVAYDSRVTRGSYIEDDEADKHVEVDGWHFFFCGSSTDLELLMKCFLGVLVPPERISASAGALVTDGVEIWSCAFIEDGGFEKVLESKHKKLAMGSGSHHAITAMDLGCSAVDAVKAAAKRDANTGGKIRKMQVFKGIYG